VKLAVVVPMLNEERAIATTLRALRHGAPEAEIIVVDGGSDDQSVAAARPLADRVIAGPRGRARQMNAGTRAASPSDALVFVHADTIVPPDFARRIDHALQDATVAGGRFDIQLDDPSWAYRMVEWFISTRSRLMRSATGDQAIFVRREIFDRLGGFQEIELCEDVDFARRLRHAGRIACLRATVVSSARRWQEHGLIRTILRMWTIKSLFLLGVSPRWLSRHYRDAR
jgi:rSAM/selenodomain-associated transferase 2